MYVYNIHIFIIIFLDPLIYREISYYFETYFEFKDNICKGLQMASHAENYYFIASGWINQEKYLNKRHVISSILLPNLTFIIYFDDKTTLL